MILQTKITLKKQALHQIDYNSKLVLLGSCFSENIGNKLKYYKFQPCLNPFGILFQPKAIESLITNAINEKKYTDKDIFFYNERWHCFDAHSSLSSSDKNTLLKNLNSANKATNNELKKASHIIITLGSSWFYREISSNKIVANCHKVPQKKFLKEILTVNEIIEILEAIIALVKTINSKAQIIFTVSPVRHLKDGFIENQQSKSHLIAGVQNTVNPRMQTHYFPSYEIMMDELRDYRFYAEDMIHPNKTAINYIWQKFSEAWFSNEALKISEDVEKSQKGLANKTFNINANQHQQFLKNIEEKIVQIQQKFPFITF